MKKLTKIITVCASSAIIAGVGASTLFFMNNSPATIDGGDDSYTGIGDSELSNEQKEIQNIKNTLFENLCSANIEFKNMDATCEDLGGNAKVLAVNYKGALDYMSFIDSRKNNTSTDDLAAKFKGNINVKFLDNNAGAEFPTQLDEDIFLQSQGSGKLYIKWNETNYTASGKIISDVLDFLPTISSLTGSELPDINSYIDAIKNIDIVSLLPIIIRTVGSLSPETDLNQTKDGEGNYTFNVTVPASLLETVGLNETGDIVLKLKCDENGLLTGIELPAITIKGLTLNLNAVTEMSIENSYVSDVNDSDYDNNLDCTTNLLTTITSLVNSESKQYGSNYNLSLKESINGIEKTRSFDGNVKVDLSAAKSINDGAIYDVSINKGTDFSSFVNVKYQNNRTYFKVGDQLAKGFIDNSTIDELMKNIVATLVGDDTEKANDATNALNGILSKSTIYDIYRGNWNAYKSIIKSLTVTDEVMTLTINAKGLLSYLPDADFTINLDLKNNGLNSVEIKDLPFRSFVNTNGQNVLDSVSFKLELEDFANITLPIATDNMSEYADFKVVTPLYNTIYNVVDSKTLGARYQFEYTKKDETSPAYSVNGDINADVNALNDIDYSGINSLSTAITTIKGENLGTYNISAHTEVNRVEHNINAVYQNEALYLDYKGTTEKSHSRMSLTQGSFFNIFDVVIGLIGGEDKTIETPSFSDINTTLEDLLNITDGKIFDILSGSKLETLGDYIQVASKDSTGLVNVKVDTTLFGNDYGNIDLVLDSTSEELASISCSYITPENGTFAFKIDFKAYEDPTISDEEITNYYKEMDTTVSSVIDMLDGSLTSLEVNGSLADPSRF